MGVEIPKSNSEHIDASQVQIPPRVQKDFDTDGITIPKLNPSQLINFGANAGITLFGILANKLLNNFLDSNANENFQTQNQINQLSFNTNKTLAPDAKPDGKGGYSPSENGYWRKRLSSITGLPVMCAITFVGTTYTALNGQQITIPTITFEMVIITMNKGRNIEKTEITGRDSGSVKEYIGAKDWTIEIRAVIMASQNVSEGMTDFYQEGKYPEENMQKIGLLLDAPIAIKVICPYINNRGINWLVIEDGVQINQIEGEYEAQRLVIPCVSDNPLVIQVGQG